MARKMSIEDGIRKNVDDDMYREDIIPNITHKNCNLY